MVDEMLAIGNGYVVSYCHSSTREKRDKIKGIIVMLSFIFGVEVVGFKGQWYDMC